MAASRFFEDRGQPQQNQLGDLKTQERVRSGLLLAGP
jgi:hypothetical protein